jgi:NADPH2 dehydrogenase
MLNQIITLSTDMGMKDPVPTYTYYINEIIQRHPDLAYLHATEKRLGSPEGLYASNEVFVAEGTENDFIRELWSAYGTNGRRLITAGGYTRETGMSVAQRKGDLIAYGRLFISNVSFLFLGRRG